MAPPAAASGEAWPMDRPDVPPEKIVAIVITNQSDSASTVTPPDSDTQSIANHLINFLKQEVDAGRMTNKLGPLQAGIGNIANTVMCGLIESPCEDLTMYSEVLQDSTFDLIDAGKLSFASGSSITLSERRNAVGLAARRPVQRECQDHEADHLINFLKEEVDAGRMTNKLGPLQAGIGNIANAVMCGLIESPFEDLTMYSEVLQDSTFDLIDAGKLSFASGSSITLSERRNADVFGNLERYKEKLVLRPQEISNHPEVVRRLGIIGINTALEFDIYGNVNSTHICGTRMMNGIGGSGDFARNAHLAIFVTKSIAKAGAISSVVPMVSHVDHTEHDVDILVTEVGLADLRGLAPRERARVIIDNCVHPAYRDALNTYFTQACALGGHTPHILREALSWHINLEETGHMLKA